jgi:hypothetical protein
MRRYVFQYEFTDISQELIASIFMVENDLIKRPARIKQHEVASLLLPSCRHLLDILFDPENRGSICYRNVSELYRASYHHVSEVVVIFTVTTLRTSKKIILLNINMKVNSIKPWV